ncbi:Smr domain family protein [Candida albicans]|uniref:Smr domain family protein n=1 Tax=Candida albicans TaxID=5476 RepID=A0A8H6BT26_CANAX|nr:Smr domain family protein [Candida albicans]
MQRCVGVSRKTIYKLIYNELKTKNDNNGAENGGAGDGKCTNGSNNFDINNETIKMIESLCELFPMFTIDELRDHPTNVDHSEDLVTELFDEATALIQSETEKEKKEKDLLSQQSKQYITNVGTPIYSMPFNSDDEQQLFNKYLKTGTVDFHGFTVVEAMKLVPLILNHWWNQELIHRQSIGQLQKFGNSASLGSVLIITGRGIHSTGGFLQLKHQLIVI